MICDWKNCSILPPCYTPCSVGDSRENSAKRGFARGPLSRSSVTSLPRQPEDSAESSQRTVQSTMNGSIDYVDPLGPAIDRPRTAARSRPIQDEFADEEIDDSLLPE